MRHEILNKPFIKKFAHQGAYYVYDANTNQVVDVEKPVYDIIEDFDENNIPQLESQFKKTYPLSQIRKSIADIRNAKNQHNLFSPFRPQKVSMGPRQAEHLKELHQKHGVRQLLLELTEDCNLNCSYCSVSGKYSDKPTHRLSMSRETCFKAVDFFCGRSHRGDQVNISFYGGEPHLRFDLIKETILYVKEKYPSHNYGFNLTTNGTIFNEEIIDFFAQYDVKVLLSLDGPKAITDRYRLSLDGKSTFDKIMRSIEKIKQYNPDFFSTNISISSVLTPPFELEAIVDFFSTHPALKELQKQGKVRSNLVNTSDTTFLEDFALRKDMNRYRGIFDRLVENLKKLILAGRADEITIEKSTIFNILFNLAKRQLKTLYDCIPPLGACFIGLRRLFVSVDGEFKICERVQFENKIGSIDTGYDYEKMAAFYRRFDELLEDCGDCWALNHCERCWAAFEDIDKFDRKAKESFCRDRKELILIAFKAYVELLKENPDSLKVLDTFNKDNS
ncbi:MAG: radical SAM protein [bacterium]|nr:radical SAM protein [bacterium]